MQKWGIPVLKIALQVNGFFYSFQEPCEEGVQYCLQSTSEEIEANKWLAELPTPKVVESGFTHKYQDHASFALSQIPVYLAFLKKNFYSYLLFKITYMFYLKLT